MEEIVHSWFYSLLYSGCICSLLLFFNVDAKFKALLETGCACIMVFTFLSPLNQVPLATDIQEYFPDLMRIESGESCIPYYTEYEKSVMEAEYSSYIISEAEKQGITDLQAVVECIKDNNLWVPYSIRYASASMVPSEFVELISEQLGVAKERQYINGYSMD